MIMEFNEGAKRLIEENLKAIMNDISLGEKDRNEIEKELRSSYYDAAESAAKQRGSSMVTVDDVKKAEGSMATPNEMATCYMRSYAGSLNRAGLLYRTAAYIIDGLILGLIIMLLVIPMIIITVSAQYLDQTSWVIALVILVNLFIAIAIFGVFFCYFVVLEGRYGRTAGKYVMGLKVLRSNGTKIGFREAILRNLPKFFGNFIIIDAIIMLIFFNKEKQRAFDKVADTIVVHTRS